MWSENTSPKFLIVVAASIAAHVALLAVLPPADATPQAPARTFITIETPPAPPPPPPSVEARVAPQETAAARLPTPRVNRPSAPRRAPEPQVATQPKPAAAEPPPMDFSGVTLSNDGASWSSPTGNGDAMTGPIGAPAPAEHAGPVHRIASGTSTERVVAVGDLSRPPRAPNLDAALAANYPADARNAGTIGTAVVRARILADGRVGTMRVISESVPGFGAACQRTLAGSHWDPPLDASSRPVITDISYTCTFAVTR
ncbi:MAG: energy transducer TonB [Deltaproteobacteria bacterium]|nr:energy transducer TonB [Deltaproteobacteria bacterium]